MSVFLFIWFVEGVIDEQIFPSQLYLSVSLACLQALKTFH